MGGRIDDRLTGLLIRDGRPRRALLLFAALVAVAPGIFLAALSARAVHDNLTTLALSRREAIARLAAVTMEAALDRAVDVGVALATRVQFTRLCCDGAWERAILILDKVPADFPYIERVFIAEPGGILRADAPAVPEVRGRSFSYRDWYQGVMRRQAPYVSEVYQRAAPPRLHVTAVAVPIRDGARLCGILVLQIRLASLFRWLEGIEVGPGGGIYLVDQRGRLATPEDAAPAGVLPDYSAEPPVVRALRGERGLMVIPATGGGPAEIAAYQPVTRYGWAVVARQSAAAAFAARDRTMTAMLAAYGAIVIAGGMLFYFGLRSLAERRIAEERARQFSEQLSRRAADLEVANRDLESFGRAVSHDLRAPLNTIGGFTEAILEDCSGVLDERGRSHLDRVRAGVRRMSDLIDALLGLSGVAYVEMRRESIDLSRLARDIAEDLRRRQPDRRVDLVVQEGLVVEGDRRLLRVALENLLGNAWKYTRRRPEARIEFGAAPANGGSGRAFFVRDNGAGFDMTHAARLFSPFQRLHAMSEFEGSGLGLATVDRILRRHGGRIWAEAAVERGATFFFTL
jgi:signal transduction histidine kinase